MLPLGGVPMPRPRTGEVRQCLRCGKEIYLSPSELSRRRHCSIECNYAAIDERRAGTCEQCGLTFAQAPSRLGRYCGWPCYSASRRTRLPIQRAEQRPCAVCDSSMTVQPYQFETKKVCS